MNDKEFKSYLHINVLIQMLYWCNSLIFLLKINIKKVVQLKGTI